MLLLKRLAEHARQKPDVAAYIEAGSARQITWRELLAQVTLLADTLRATYSERSVVLIQCPNCCEFPIAFLAVLMANCTAFPLSPDTPAIELESIAQRSSAVAMIGVDGMTRLTETGNAVAYNDCGLMLLSSGSTGTPKIVCRSIASLDAVCNQMCQAIEITSDDRILATVPLCHSYGIEHGLLAPIWAGATVHICRGLDLPVIQRSLLQSEITVLPAVPAMYEMLAKLLEFGTRFQSLRAAYSAGAPLPVSIAEKFHQQCGVRIGQIFGASEIGSVTYSNPASDHFDPAGVGQPMPGVQVKIVENAVHISAASMFSGYLNECAPLLDGFYPTGDIGHFDSHGNLFITGRTKLLIDIGGLKVNPLEVEELLLKHPSVGDCVVIAVRQSETVMRLKAVVTPKSADHPIDTQMLRDFARSQLASYKVPRIFEVRDRLPRTETGKILRHLVEA